MKFFQNIIIYIFVLGNLLFTQEIYTRGVLYPVEASFCMDQCSEYMLEGESGEFITNLTSLNEIDLSYFIKYR